MENYEKIENEIHSFKKYLKMTDDLLCDSYKWKKLSEYTDDPRSKEKFKNISNTLYSMFMEEHENIDNMFKGE